MRNMRFQSRARRRVAISPCVPVVALIGLLAACSTAAEKRVDEPVNERYFVGNPETGVVIKTRLPVGFQDFHRNKFLNLELNRWYSAGYARLADVRKAAARIKTAEDNKGVFLELAEQAMAEGRLKNAAAYYRAAEFTTEPSDPDKLLLYNKYIEVFYEAFKDDAIERRRVPYENGFLPVMRLAPEGEKKGTILVHIGFDSMIEEFYCISRTFAENGYEVFAFDGPGQGGALRLYNVVSDHAWEKPVKAVLDFFDLSDVTILGVSMGGYWCLRAAAFEKRITRVIVFPPLLDWLESVNGGTRLLVKSLMKREGLMRWAVGKKMNDPQMKNVINNTLFITQKEDVMDVVRWELAMNKEFLHSELVGQDVLLLGGEKDMFQPITLYHKQMKALTNARSVTGRVFTDADLCPYHCAFGNMGLALEVMVTWLNGKVGSP